MQRKTFGLLAFLLIPFCINAKIYHRLEVGTQLYSNVFNVEKDPFILNSKTNFSSLYESRSLAYSLEYKKFNLCYSSNYYLMGYNEINNLAPGPHDLIWFVDLYSKYLYGAYNLIEKNSIQLQCVLGALHSKVIESKVKFVVDDPLWPEVRFGSFKETRMNILTGVKLNVDIYKNLYATTECLYAKRINAVEYKQNIQVNFRLGYKFRLKRKKKEY